MIHTLLDLGLAGEYSFIVPNARAFNENDCASFPVFQGWIMAMSGGVFLTGIEGIPT